MSSSAKSLLLEDEIGLLVKYFGLQRVKAALDKISIGDNGNLRDSTIGIATRSQKTTRTTADVLEAIREIEPEKHGILSAFQLRLKSRDVLPESQDIRYFAQTVGLKEINGKSRKDMVPKLMRFLVDQPIERLKVAIPNADTISKERRQMGFSVLTDKLLSNR